MRPQIAHGPDISTRFVFGRVASETALLLASSVTFGVGLTAMETGRTRLAFAALIVTLALAGGFLALEYAEFSALIATGHGPSQSGALSAYFVLVGTHGLHVAAGSLWLCLCLVQSVTRGHTPDIVSRTSRLGMFWHFLDIVWVGIFSLVYLPAFV